MKHDSTLAFIRHLLDMLPIFEDDNFDISRWKLERYLRSLLPKEGEGEGL